MKMIRSISVARRWAFVVMAAAPLCGAIPDLTASKSHEADLAAFFREVDRTYPFFELKGIRGDWTETKSLLAERAKSCATDTGRGPLLGRFEQ